MSKSIMSFRLEDELRDCIRVWALQDRRTISSYVESLLLQEKSRREGNEVTLWSLDEKLDRVLLSLAAANSKKVNKNDKEKPKLNPYAVELPDYIDRDDWIGFIRNVQAQRKQITEPALLSYLEDARILYEDGQDVNELLRKSTRKMWINFRFEKKEEDQEESVIQRLTREVAYSATGRSL